MESLGKIASGRTKNQRLLKADLHLHSPNHLLADELSNRLNDKKHFGFYLKMATLYDHEVLRQLMGQVLESKGVKNPGRLFAFLVKKHNQQTKQQ